MRIRDKAVSVTCHLGAVGPLPPAGQVDAVIADALEVPDKGAAAAGTRSIMSDRRGQ